MRFNGKQEFNQAFGNRKFTMDFDDLQDTIKWFQQDNVSLYNLNAYDLNIKHLTKHDFVYLDPPYLIASAGYNGKYDSDEQLFDLCNQLDKHKTKWAMSNVFKHRGYKNKWLINWCKRNDYNVVHFDYSYHIKGTSNSKSDEVLIMNY